MRNECVAVGYAPEGARCAERCATYWFRWIARQPKAWFATERQILEFAAAFEKLLYLRMMKVSADFGHSCEAAFDGFSIHA